MPAGGGRSIFALPWLGHALVGTTDNDYEGSLDHIGPSVDDIGYLLEAVNVFFGTEFGPDELTGAFAGVRPLISTGDPKKSVDISRKAELYETSSGMITITGGKLTTFRRMAKMAVDRIVEREARDAPCRTQEIPLGQAVPPDQLPRVEGVPEDAYAALAGRYGHAAREVLELAATRGELAQPIVPDLPDLLAEVALAARHEQARSIGDVLLRRTRLGLLAGRELGQGDNGVRARHRRRRAGDVLARELGWDEQRLELELAPLRAGGPRRGHRPVRLAGGVRRSASRRAPRPRFERPAPHAAGVRAGDRAGPRPWLMGVVNASPDSFSDGGVHADLDARVELARRLLGDGADIIDIGGESATTGSAAGGGRGGARAGGAADRGRRPRPRARWCRWTPTSRRSPPPRSRPGPASSTTSAGCATRSWPRCVPPPGPRWW